MGTKSWVARLSAGQQKLLLIGLGSVNNQISSTRDASALDPDTGFFAPEQAPPSLDYVPDPKHPPSPDYVPGLKELEQVPLSLDYVPEPQHPKYLVDAEVCVEDQPQPTHALPATLSPSYIADSDPEEDLEEDPEEDHVDYPVDRGDDDDESSDYYNDDDDDVKEDKDDEEEERLAPGNSSAIPIGDPVPSAEDIEAFKNDESAPTPPSPRPLRARISVKLLPLMRASMEARIIKYAFAATPPSPPPSLLSPWYEVGESSLTIVARQDIHTLAHRVDYGFVDTVDTSIRASESRVMTAIWEDDRALLGAQVSILRRERRCFRSMASSYEREAVIARQAWSHSKSMP
ncbi:hypothetical protein Tco_0709414 [Tanacetum coccineum]